MTTDDLFAAYSAAMPALERCLENALLFDLACSLREAQSRLSIRQRHCLSQPNAMWSVYWAASELLEVSSNHEWWLFRIQCESAKATLRDTA